MISKLQSGAFVTIFAACVSCNAQTIDPQFRDCYTIRDIGTPTGIPGSLGGINFLPGNNNVLLVGGGANGSAGTLYTVPIVRDANNVITGFGGPPEAYTTAPFLDGGLAIAPNNTLFVTTFNNNLMHQIIPGAAAPASSTALSPFGVIASVGACQFVPAGFPGEGRLKIASYSASTWYDFTIGNPVAGVYTMSRDNVIEIQIGGGPEGIVFVGAGNPGFPAASCLVTEYAFGRVVAYRLNANGDPLVDTRRIMITGLGGAEGGIRDPLTGSFLFSTFGGGNRIVIVEGFNRDCAANYNGDCAVDFFDYLDFVSAFASNDPAADFNHDQVVDFFDYLDFVAAYASC